MGSPSLGAISSGIRFQMRYFWLQALPMLYEDTVVEVSFEHRGAKAVDDLVVVYKPPGVNDRGARVTADFAQLKYHVAQGGAVTSANLVDPDWTSTKESMLKRFFDAWQQLRGQHPQARLLLVTNWAFDASDRLAPLLRHDGYLAPEFLTKKPPSKLAGIRKLWCGHLGVEEDLLGEFVARLRISTSAFSQNTLETWISDRCRLAGLVPPDPTLDHCPYDDLGTRLLEQGRTVFTRDSLWELCRSQNLVDTTPSGYASSAAVRSFTHFAHVPEGDGAVVLDLTEHFDGRQPRGEDVWAEAVPRRVAAEFLPALRELTPPILLALDVHLSIAWYLGTQLNAKAGLDVMLRQKGLGKTENWDTRDSDERSAEGWLCEDEVMGEGCDMAVAVSATFSTIADVRSAVSAMPSVGRLLHARLPDPGPEAVRDGGHAVWLAEQLAARLREQLTDGCRIHLFASWPVSLSFLFGQRSGGLGPMTVYEFDFDGDRRYRAGISRS